jgi:predicted phosphodiesterase
VKIAAISDIHGNLPALEAVLADIATHAVDIIVNLGDILSGPLWAADTADRLMALALPTIAGNHERQLLTQPIERMSPPGRPKGEYRSAQHEATPVSPPGRPKGEYRSAQHEGTPVSPPGRPKGEFRSAQHGGTPMSASDAHTAAELQAHHRDWLANLPATLPLTPQVWCCHGTPTSDLTYFLETVIPGFAGVGRGANGVRVATLTEATERAGTAMQGIAHAVILCGHTHVPRVMRLADGRLVVNPGSVGLQGFDDDHGHPHVIETRAPHARYALLERGAAGWSVSLRAVAYDWERAAARAEREGRPDWADALRTGFMGRLEGEGAAR